MLLAVFILWNNIYPFRKNYQSESERWKDLATERLTKMEQLNLQLEERHCQEVFFFDYYLFRKYPQIKRVL